MKSHELAKMLLAMPNKPMTLVYSVNHSEYTQDLSLSHPWEDLFGCVRIQAIDLTSDAKTNPGREEGELG